MACVSSATVTDDTHWTETTCYADGVKRRQTSNDTIETTTTLKADGSLCYSAVLDTALSIWDISDALGNLVAHIDLGSPSTIETITCRDGSVTHVDLTVPVCADYAAGTSVCTTGTCNW
jgi:hypothetical protein